MMLLMMMMKMKMKMMMIGVERLPQTIFEQDGQTTINVFDVFALFCPVWGKPGRSKRKYGLGWTRFGLD